ncbi:MAG: BamA/TamA family outer membrane protein [Candidatus Competibacteraceae bacterium]
MHFFDVGNVFATVGDFDAGDLRYSTGIQAIWLSPLGPLVFSVAQPLNDEDEDETETFHLFSWAVALMLSTVMQTGVSTLKGLLLLFSLASVLPISALQAAELKIGFVNTAKILSEAPHTKELISACNGNSRLGKRDLADAQKSLRGLEQKRERRRCHE